MAALRQQKYVMNTPDWRGQTDLDTHLTRNIWKSEIFYGIEIQQDEMINFIAMIEAEAWWEWRDWKQAVASAILNRLKTPWHPKTMNWVLFEWWQFSPMTDWRFNSIVQKGNFSKDSIDVAYQLVRWQLKSNVWNSTFFQVNKLDSDKSQWQTTAKTLKMHSKIGNHTFRVEKQYA